MKPYQEPRGEYEKFVGRAKAHMNDQGVPDQIKTLAERAFNDFLRDEPVVLTRNEKRKIYKTLLQEIFDEITADL